jgi:hypothetical protein
MFLVIFCLLFQDNKHTSTSKYKIQKRFSLNQHENNLDLSLLNMSCGCMEEVDELRRLHACPESIIVDGRSCLCGLQGSIVEIEEDHAKGYCIGIKGAGRRRRMGAPELERYDTSSVTRKRDLIASTIDGEGRVHGKKIRSQA